jgi:hypothetical protein
MTNGGYHMSVLKILMDARATITKRKNWTIGIRRAPRLGGGNAYCALGAIEAAIGLNSSMLDLWHEGYCDTCRALVQNLEGEHYTGPHVLVNENLIAEYNNNHSHKEVLAWFDRAIASQRAQAIKDIIPIVTRELEYA